MSGERPTKTDREIQDAVSDLLTGRCSDEADVPGCELDSERDYDGPIYTVVLAGRDTSPFADPPWDCVAYSLCNDCTSIIRDRMRDDVLSVRTYPRAGGAHRG